MLGIGEITVDGLKMIGFKRQGKTEWVWRSDDSFNRILVDVINKEDVKYLHVSIECLNDSIEVPNAKNLSDITALQVLFK